MSGAHAPVAAAVGAPRQDADVIVVGGGPAGSSAAYFLARAGVNVLLLDRARFPRDKPCAEYLSPQASRILSEMGALNLVESAGAAQLTGMVIRAPNGERIHGEFAAEHGFRGFRDRGLALRRTLLDAILLERARAAGVRVEEGVRVTDLVRDATGRIIGVRRSEPDGWTSPRHAPVVIGADGLRSLVANRLGLSRSSRWPRRLALVTHYRGLRDVAEFGEMHVERSGYLGIADVGHGETNVALVVPVAEGRAISANRDLFFDRWIASCAHLAPRFAGARRVSPIRATGPFASSVRRAWAPGAALVGDAADFFDPFTGEGMYAGLRGGELLAPFVLEALKSDTPAAADAALEGYEAARRAEFGGKWLVEKLVGAAVSSPRILNHVARTLARRRDMADLLVGVAGDFVPPREVLRPGFLLGLLLPVSRS